MSGGTFPGVTWLFLGLAICTEVTATLFLRASTDADSKAPYLVVIAVGYVISFWCLAQALNRGMSVGVAYGVWSGVGVATIAVLGRFLFDESLTAAKGVGLALIIAGVAVIELAGGER